MHKRTSKEVQLDSMNHHDEMIKEGPSEEARERFRRKPYELGSDKNAGCKTVEQKKIRNKQT